MTNDSEKKDARISLLTIRLKWFIAAFIVFALEIGTYAYFLMPYEIAKGKPAMETTQAIFAHMANFLTVAFGSVVLIFGGIDIMMILRDYFRAEREKRIQREADAARAQGLTEGKAQGTTDMYQQWAAWNTRRLDAEAKGQPFTELPPPPPQ